MLDENLNTEALPGAEQDVPAAGGSVSDSEAGQQVRDFHQVVNDLTGKNFPSPEAAAKSIVDTFNATGKWGKFKPLIESLEQRKGGEQAVLKLMEELTQDQPKVEQAPATPSVDVTSELSEMKRQLKETQFYADHPEYKDVKHVIAKFGADPEKVVADETFKTVYEGLKARTEADASRSVIHSNTNVEASSDYNEDLSKLLSNKGQATDWVSFLKKHKGIELT